LSKLDSSIQQVVRSGKQFITHKVPFLVGAFIIDSESLYGFFCLFFCFFVYFCLFLVCASRRGSLLAVFISDSASS